MLSRPLPSYASATADLPLLGETIGSNFEHTVARHGDREALVDLATRRRWTYSELDVEVDAFALGLMELGITKGDRVGVWAPSCAEWVVVHYATAKIGAILVSVDPACRFHELRDVVRRSGMRLLVSAAQHRADDDRADDDSAGEDSAGEDSAGDFGTADFGTGDFGTADYRAIDRRAMVAEIRPCCPHLLDTMVIGDDAWRDLFDRGGRADHQRLDERMAQLSFDDPINIRYTSDTTGISPRGATLSHHNILNSGYFVTEMISITRADRMCVPVPMYHCFGMVLGVLGAFSHGAAVVLPSHAFDPEDTLRAVQEERCTALYGVPAMFTAELAHPAIAAFDLSTLRAGLMVGAPCPIEVMKRVVTEMHLAEVATAYGVTETSLVSVMTRRDDDLTHRTSTVGTAMPMPHVEIKIVDPVAGVEVPRGTPGELCTRGYSVMLGYWEDPERTAEAIDGAGWMHSGDLAIMDASGYVSVSGRIKDRPPPPGRR